MESPFQCDWTGIRNKCRDEVWAGDVLNAIREDFNHWSGVIDLPNWTSETHRFHTYYCDADGQRLSWQADKPDSHKCSKCGRIYTGEPWNGAWRAQMHSAAALQVERAAILMRLGNEREISLAANALDKILLFYAKHYAAYPIHGDRPGQEGRVMPHRLNEAVWLTSLLRSLRWSGYSDTLSSNQQSEVERMAKLGVDLLRPQIRAIHNHFTWLLAAIAECAAALQDRNLLEWCRDHEFGMHAQIDRGFHDDGFWFESSTTYQYYTLESVLSYAEAAGPEGIQGADRYRKLILAVNNPPRLAYLDGMMPAYADGWLDTPLQGFAHIAERAHGLWGAEIRISPYYKNEVPMQIRATGAAVPPGAKGASVAHRASVSALLYGPVVLEPDLATDEGLVIFPSAGIATLRNDQVRIGLRYGPDGGFHDHKDKLNVDIECASGWRSLDLGTSGYGSEFTEWLRSPFSHNILVIDGERQMAHEGRLVGSSPSNILAAAEYDGVKFLRSISLLADGWRDDYGVTLDRLRKIEWFFHGDGIFTFEEGHFEPATCDSCPWFTNIVRLASGANLTGSWRSESGIVKIELPIPAGFTAFCAEAPGNAGGRPLGVVFLQGYAAGASFPARFLLGDLAGVSGAGNEAIAEHKLRPLSDVKGEKR